MRKIKFRAWDKKRELWLWANGALGKHFTSGNQYGGWELNINPNVILMQFTGLKDKNGKEIYEGDILRLPINKKRFMIDPKIYGQNYIIQWQELRGCFQLKHATRDLDYHGFDKEEAMEVIGNIYENPDLLPSDNKKV